MNTKNHMNSNLFILFGLIQFVFLIILAIFYFLLKKNKKAKLFFVYLNSLSFKQKLTIFCVLNMLIVLIAFLLKKQIKLNPNKINNIIHKILFLNFQKHSNNFKIQADEQDILKNTYYYDDSEENKNRIIKSTFNKFKKDPRDTRQYYLNQYFQDEQDKTVTVEKAKQIHIKSEINAYVIHNYDYDELLLLDKLLDDEIETFFNKQFNPEETGLSINDYLKALGYHGDGSNNNHLILKFNKLPPNPTKRYLAQNYLDKKEILHIFRFELEREIRISYFNATGKLFPFMVL